ncbi:MAG TPA: hypothetical protein ENG47_02775, partial [Candidatus Aerophobetes bacterium]|nr:hypothetical protein [Candidatus Aerophobetes bacterium]
MPFSSSNFLLRFDDWTASSHYQSKFNGYSGNYLLFIRQRSSSSCYFIFSCICGSYFGSFIFIFGQLSVILLSCGRDYFFTPYFQEKFKFLPGWLRTSLSVSIAAQLCLLPLLGFYFGQLPLIGILANLIIVPLITFILALGFLSLALSIFTFQGAQILANTNWLGLHALLSIVNFFSFSRFPYLNLFFSPKVNPFPAWVILV